MLRTYGVRPLSRPWNGYVPAALRSAWTGEDARLSTSKSWVPARGQECPRHTTLLAHYLLRGGVLLVRCRLLLRRLGGNLGTALFHHKESVAEFVNGLAIAVRSGFFECHQLAAN
jgi:hypothetical protein